MYMCMYIRLCLSVVNRDLEEAHKEKERQRKLKTLSKAMEKEKKAEEEANRKALRAKRKAARESAKAEKKEMERLQKLQQEREVEEKKRNDDSKNDNDNNNQTAGNGDGDGNDQNVHTMKNRESIMPLSAPIDDDGSNTHTINESGTISAGSTATSKPKVIKSHTSTKAGFLSPKPELSYRQLRPSIIGRHRHMLSTIDTVTMSSIGDSAGIDSGNGARSSLAKSSGGGEMNSNIMGASILTTMTALSSAATENTAVGASSETGYSYTTSNTTSNLTATTTTTASKRARRQGINTGDANTKGISVENLLNTRQPGVAAKLKLDAQMIEARQKMMREAKSIRKRAQQERIELMVWRDTLNRTLDPLSKEQSEHVWPRDVLFRYLMAMEKLQNNNKEFQDLQYLAAIGIHQLYEKETRNDLG